VALHNLKCGKYVKTRYATASDSDVPSPSLYDVLMSDLLSWYGSDVRGFGCCNIIGLLKRLSPHLGFSRQEETLTTQGWQRFDFAPQPAEYRLRRALKSRILLLALALQGKRVVENHKRSAHGVCVGLSSFGNSGPGRHFQHESLISTVQKSERLFSFPTTFSLRRSSQ